MHRSLVLALAFVPLVTTAAIAQARRQDELRRQIRQAEVLERAGQLSRALTALDAVLEDSPAEAQAVRIYDRIRRRQGRLDLVVPVVERAVAADPTSAQLRQLQLRVLTDLGLFEELQEAGERWLRGAPRLEEAYLQFASALLTLGRAHEAERVLLRGEGAVARPMGLAVQLGDLYLEEGRWSETVEQWLLLLSQAPVSGWELINQRLHALGPQAVPVALAVLRRIPADAPALSERRLAAVAALYAGETEMALAHAEAVLDALVPHEREPFVTRFATLAATLEQPALVAWAYRRLFLYTKPDSLRWNLTRQSVQHDLSAGDTAAALAALEGLLAGVQPGDDAHRWASGVEVRLQAARGRLGPAEQALQRFIARYGSDRQVGALALAVADAHLRRGRVAEADRILGLVPERGLRREEAARLAATRGYLAFYAGRQSDAQRELERAAAALTGEERGAALRILRFLRGGNEGELRAVASAHRALLEREPEKALQRLLNGLDQAPASAVRPALLLWAGELALAADERARAEEVLRRIVERYPGSGEAPAALVTLAEVLADRGRREEAIGLLEALILDYPESALTPLGRRRLAELLEEVPRS